jgi:hypothetical protein
MKSRNSIGVMAFYPSLHPLCVILSLAPIRSRRLPPRVQYRPSQVLDYGPGLL